MKYYYAFKILILNTLSRYSRKLIGLEHLPTFILDWFLDRYIYNLTELAKRLNDNESLHKINLMKYYYENKEKE